MYAITCKAWYGFHQYVKIPTYSLFKYSQFFCSMLVTFLCLSRCLSQNQFLSSLQIYAKSPLPPFHLPFTLNGVLVQLSIKERGYLSQLSPQHVHFLLHHSLGCFSRLRLDVCLKTIQVLSYFWRKINLLFCPDIPRIASCYLKKLLCALGSASFCLPLLWATLTPTINQNKTIITYHLTLTTYILPQTTNHLLFNTSTKVFVEQSRLQRVC